MPCVVRNVAYNSYVRQTKLNLVKRAKNKVKDELNPTDEDKQGFDIGDAQEQKGIYRKAKK
jgi:hypothetical protein